VFSHVGPAGRVRLENSVALAQMGSTLLSADGVLGTVHQLSSGSVASVVGRYPQTSATIESGQTLARYLALDFGAVRGVAYDPTTNLIYLTESSAGTDGLAGGNISHRVYAVTPNAPGGPDTWTMVPIVNSSGEIGNNDGSAATARLHDPTGLFLDDAARILYIVDTGNHALRALNLMTNTVTTVVNRSRRRGFFGDGGLASAARLLLPRAVAKCSNGDIFVADTGNNRIRRIDHVTGNISTVLGDGVAASSGQGAPANTFPIHSPLGIACDMNNNVFATSRTTVRMLVANDAGIVDGSGRVDTVYGLPPRNEFPRNESTCLSGILSSAPSKIIVSDACSGLVLQLENQ
jgi:hypothetical protein